MAERRGGHNTQVEVKFDGCCAATSQYHISLKKTLPLDECDQRSLERRKRASRGALQSCAAFKPTTSRAGCEHVMLRSNYDHGQGAREPARDPHLKMSDCRQSTITDKAFECLRGIHTLNMSSCSQTTITDKAFENLRGIHTLKMSCCDQIMITDDAFHNLSGIHT